MAAEPAQHASPASRLPRDSAGSCRATLALVGTVLLAAALRLPALTQVPPGLNQDEAANAWNAYCLLKTGRDQTGASWPIFYYRALGENRSALFLYLLLPFQAVGGLNVWTTRLPAACAGTLTILLFYWVARRLFDRPTGLVAALLLALNPAHIEMSRWGHEASMTPLLTLAPLAALLWAGLPLDDRAPRPRVWRALVAGFLAGICCYGYPAARLFIPVLAAAAVLVTGDGWQALLKARRGPLALAALLLGVAATFGPLAYMHLTDEDIGKRAAMTWLWRPEDPLATRLAAVADRYAAHFQPGFLFRFGDADGIAWAPGFGFLPWYLLPLGLLGLALLVPRLRRSRAARLAVLGVVLYPVGDTLNWHTSLHALRSSAGLIWLVLPAAVAIVPALRFVLARRLRAALVGVLAALAGLVLPEEGRFLYIYFTQRPQQQEVYTGNAVALMKACQWLRPRLPDVDAVICTTLDLNQPYLITLVALGHDPRAWFAGPREMHNDGHWDVYTRYGKLYFLPAAGRERLLERLAATGRPQRIVLLLNPAEPLPVEPAERIPGPDGQPALLIYDLRV